METALHLLRRVDLGKLLGSDHIGPTTPSAILERAADQHVEAKMFNPFGSERPDAIVQISEAKTNELRDDGTD